ncbi:MAG: heavy metal sensor histidine kinase [Chloroflexia bacterium]|nr:heavy metal sensor histidine kinase [Chloroflexia bacterium]
MRRLPVRWRLTLWFAAILAAILLAFGGLLYAGLRQRLDAGFDEQLLTQAAVTLAAVQIRGDTPALNAASGGEQEGEYFLRLVDREGRIVFDNGATLGGVPQDPAAVATAFAGGTSLSSVVVRGDEEEDLRVATLPVRRNGDEGPVVGALRVGLDRHDLDEVLNELLAALAVAAPLTLAAAAAAGYVLAGRALAPVAEITRLAASIGGDDLHARLGLNLPNDELGRLARTFDGMLGRIEDAFERQRRFTGDAAHELRTPLSLLRSQVDVALAQPRSGDEYREALAGLDADLRRLTGLVTTLLALARADTGRLPLEPEPFDLAETVAATVEQYASLAAEAGLELRAVTAPTPLVADEDLLVQVLVNLVENALAHTPAAGTVTIGCRREGRLACLWVEDTGIGIAAEHRVRVFDRFYRIDTGRTRAAGGTGLGLAICRAIAMAHGGTIGLTSRVGGGTRVELGLPADPAPPAMPTGD